MKTNKGLTLIALVITIIVLLILAGVSISIAVGDNGVLTRAAKTEIEYNKGEVLESINMFAAEYYLKRYDEAPEDQRAQVQIDADEFIRALYIGWNEASAVAEDEDSWNEGSWNADDRFFKIDGDHTAGSSRDKYYGFDDTVDGTKYKIYVINLSALKRQITKYGTGTKYSAGDVFIVRRAYNNDNSLNGNLEVCYKTGINDSVNPQGVAVIGSINLSMP